MRGLLIAGFVAVLALCGWSTSAVEPSDTLGPYTAAGNFAADLFGAVDTRENTWGRAEAATWQQQFQLPPGYRVQILEITGDLMAWPTDSGIGPALVDPGRCYGVLAGLHVTDDEGYVRGGSARGTLMADDTLFYVQGGACGSVAVNKDFYVDLRDVENAVLGRNHVLIWKVAAWLNDTGYPIHVEPTFSSLKYRWVADSPTK
jgi:hypothetical protein